ncbi:MAG: hypothetical protein SGI77_12510 [Pirellulaceae bacterium]|nr:hypothetical protein [Pirellulaceae bacterium]
MSEAANEGVSIRCPECQKRLKVPAKLAGKRVPCPNCKSMLNLPMLKEPAAEQPSQPPAAPVKSVDDDLDDIGFKLADVDVKPKAASPMGIEQLGIDMAELSEKEFSYSCKVCSSRMYAKPSQIGSNARCPDCYSEFSIPSPPPPKAKAREPDLNAIADVSLSPLQGSSLRSKEFGRSTADEYLAKATEEAEKEGQEQRDETYDFDTAGWMKRTFAFLGDPSVIVIAITSGLFLGGVLVGAAYVSEAAGRTKTIQEEIESAKGFGFMAILLLFGAPLLGLTLANGIAILEASANKMKRIANWPIFNPTDSFSEIVVVIAAFALALLPGGILSWFASSIGLSQEWSMAIVLFSAYLLFPFVLISMLNNQSISEPFSQDIFGSMSSKRNAWGAMYMLSGMAMTLIFLLWLFSSGDSPGRKFIFGLLLPIIIFFIFHQFGVLGSRIADVTNLDFESEDEGDEQPENADSST